MPSPGSLAIPKNTLTKFTDDFRAYMLRTRGPSYLAPLGTCRLRLRLRLRVRRPSGRRALKPAAVAQARGAGPFRECVEAAGSV